MAKYGRTVCQEYEQPVCASENHLFGIFALMSNKTTFVSFDTERAGWEIGPGARQHVR